MRRYHYRRILIIRAPPALVSRIFGTRVFKIIQQINRFNLKEKLENPNFFNLRIKSNKQKGIVLFYSFSTLNKTDRESFCNKECSGGSIVPSSMTIEILFRTGHQEKEAVRSRDPESNRKRSKTRSPFVGEREEEQQLTRIPFRKSSRALSFHPLSS